MMITAELPHWPALSQSERRAIFEPMWNEGASASEIALAFTGATRNSIIGAVSRAKLKRDKRSTKPRGNHVVRMPKAKAKRVPPAPTTKRERADFANLEPDASATDLITSLRPPLPGIEPISLLELPNRPGVRCRFPVEGGYCGAGCGEDMYCAPHQRRVYSVPPAQKKRAG